MTTTEEDTMSRTLSDGDTLPYRQLIAEKQAEIESLTARVAELESELADAIAPAPPAEAPSVDG